MYKNSTSFRLVFGRVADHPQVNCVVLQQLALVVIGSCTMLLVAAQYFGWFTFYALVIFILFMGIFDGCFITMFGPIAYKICGPQVWPLTHLFRFFMEKELSMGESMNTISHRRRILFLSLFHGWGCPSPDHGTSGATEIQEMRKALITMSCE